MTVTPTVTSQYNLGPVKPWVQNAAYLIGPMFGIKTIYGWRKTDPFPDHPSGHALDFMTPNKAAGDALANYAVTNASALGVKYIIWYHQYWDPQTGWVPYTQTTNPHTDHVHITFLDQPAAFTATPPGSGGGTAVLTAAVDDLCAFHITFPSVVGIGGGPTCLLTKTQARAILGGIMLASGVVIGVIGVVVLLAYGLGQTRAANLLPDAVRQFI